MLADLTYVITINKSEGIIHVSSKGICCQVLIDTLDQHSINNLITTWSTLIDIPVTSWSSQFIFVGTPLGVDRYI